MSEPGTEPLFKLLEGVHRCVAAHLLGLTEIAACVDDDGALGPVQQIPLSRIYSPKPEIARWDHRRDFHVLLKIMGDEAERERLDPVELSPVPPHVAKYLTLIADVVYRDR